MMRLCLHIIFFLPLLMFSCTLADVVPADKVIREETVLEVSEVGMSMEVVPMSKAIVTGAPDDGGMEVNPNPLEQIGVSVIRQEGEGVFCFYSPANPTQTFGYNPITGRWQQKDGESPLLLAFEQGRAYAWSPVGTEPVLPSGGSDGLQLSGIKILDNEVFSFDTDVTVTAGWNVDQEDYLYGTGLNENGDWVDGWNPKISVTMQHALGRVSFRIMKGEEDVSEVCPGVQSVTFRSTSGYFLKAETGKMALTDGRLIDTSVCSELCFSAGSHMRSVSSHQETFTGVPVQAFGLVAPVSGITATIELKLDDGRIYTMGENSDGTTVVLIINWEAGKEYIYDLRLVIRTLVIDGLTVGDWETGNGNGANIPVDKVE